MQHPHHINTHVFRHCWHIECTSVVHGRKSRFKELWGTTCLYAYQHHVHSSSVPMLAHATSCNQANWQLVPRVGCICRNSASWNPWRNPQVSINDTPAGWLQWKIHSHIQKSHGWFTGGNMMLTHFRKPPMQHMPGNGCYVHTTRGPDGPGAWPWYVASIGTRRASPGACSNQPATQPPSQAPNE